MVLGDVYVKSTGFDQRRTRFVRTQLTKGAEFNWIAASDVTPHLVLAQANARQSLIGTCCHRVSL